MKKIFFALGIGIFILFIVACKDSPMEQKKYSVEAFNTQLATNPDDLNGRTIQNAALDGVMSEGDIFITRDGYGGVLLENMTIRNLSVKNASLRFAHFRNVTFINCIFYKVDFTGSRFDNVRFIGGSFDGQEAGKVIGHETKLTDVLANNVVFDGVTFGAGVDVDYRGGIITLRGVKAQKTLSRYTRLAGGKNIHVRLENCTINDRQAVYVAGQSTVYASNCAFNYGGIAGSAKIIFIDKSTIVGSSADAEVFVVRDSSVAMSVGESEFDTTDVYFSGNTFPDHSEMEFGVNFFGAGTQGSKANAYIYGGGKIIPRFAASGGSIHIYDCDIGKFVSIIEPPLDYFESLNMKNVTIRKGYWSGQMPHKGSWDNVKIYPPVKMRDKPEYEYTIIGHNVTFPDGLPWVNGAVNITKSERPLEFAKPPVPTPEQLGLPQFWEAVDRGETPDPPRGLQQGTEKTGDEHGSKEK